MKNSSKYIFKIAWAKMPLSKEELETIPYSHRVRPYLLCMDTGDYYYYAFPTTSKVVNNKRRYENEKVIINHGTSLVNLHEIYKLPKNYLLEYPKPISSVYSNEIIKKINACVKYSEYPQEFSDFFANKKYSLEENDIVTLDENLYVIIQVDAKKYYLHKVYPYPVNGSVFVEIDALKYYVDVSSLCELKKNTELTYHTRISECSFENINIKDWLLSKPILRNQKDYTLFENLMPGMVLDTFLDNEDIRMIILEKNEDEMEILYGSPQETYSNYQLGHFSRCDIPFYSIISTLSDDRLEKLRSKHIEKEYNRKKKY